MLANLASSRPSFRPSPGYAQSGVASSFAVKTPGCVKRRVGGRSGVLKMLLVGLALLAGAGKSAWAFNGPALPASCAAIGTNYFTPVEDNGYFNPSLVAGDVISVSSLNQGATGVSITGGTASGNLTSAGQSYTIPTSGTYQIYIEGSVGNAYLTCSPAPPQTTFTVTTTADDATGMALNCATGSTTACTLRDALAAAAASTSTGLKVNFATSLAGSGGTTPFTITLGTSGTLTVPKNTTIQGLTTGSGASLTNLVTVDGAYAYGAFSVASGVTASINNLAIQHSVSQSGVVNAGTLSVNQCSFSSNTIYLGNGGAINSSGTLTVTNSTFYSNTAAQGNGGVGGAIYASPGSTLQVSHSTFYGNFAATGGALALSESTATLTNLTVTQNTADTGGGIYSTTTVPITNSIVAANTANVSYPDLDGTASGSNNIINAGPGRPSSYTAATLTLAALGYYGGPTETMPVLPRSPAFCLLHSTTAPAASTEQRGFQGSTNYGGFYCTDAGATNSSYSLVWTTQPAASYNVGAYFPTTGPIVSFEDNGSVLPLTETGSASSLAIYDAKGELNGAGNIAHVDWTTGTANVSSGYVALAESSDTLVAYYGLPAYPYASLTTGNTNTFAVVSPLAGFSISGPTSPVAAGVAENVTVTALSSLSPVTTATNFTGTVTFSSTDSAATLPASYTFTSGDAGVHSFIDGVTFKTAGSQTITATSGTVSQPSGSVLVSAGAAATVAAVYSTTISAATGAAYGTTALQVQVLDAYSNPVPSITVTYTVPTSGPSATLSSSTCTTNSSGMCAVTATASAVAGSYTISAAAMGVSTPVTFHATNTGNAIFTVTVATDTTTGVASNCTVGSTTDSSCSLRDALAAAAALPGSSTVPVAINFGSAFSTATTITEANGTLTVPAYTTIQGRTTGTGATLTNLVTVNGNAKYTVFTANGTAAALDNLIITNGGITNGQVATSFGGAYVKSGSLTVNQCTISNNTAGSVGAGGITNPAGSTLTVNQSLIFGNGGIGGGIQNSGSLTVTSSTFANNSTTNSGGGSTTPPAERQPWLM